VSTATDDAVESSPASVAARRAPRVFYPTFSIPGLLVAGLFFALSVQPSLLPRAGYVQGIAAGITMAIGYGIGAGGQALWNYLGIPKLPERARTIGRWIIVVLILWAVVFSAWRYVGWQNEIRTLFGMDSITFTVWPIIIGVALLTAALLLVVSRSLRLLFRTVFVRLGRRLPRRLAIVLGAGGLLLLFWLLITGVLVNGFFAVSNAIFEGLPRIRGRLRVIAVSMALIGKLAPIARPFSVAKKGTLLAVNSRAPFHNEWQAASRAAKSNSRNQPV